MTNESLKTKVAVLEERVCDIGGQIKEIKDNHLAHIQADIKELMDSRRSQDVKMAIMWTVGLVAVWLLDKLTK